MMSTIREALLTSSKNLRTEILEFPELGIKVKVKGMTFSARTLFLRDCMLTEDRLDMVKAVPRAIIETFVDPLNDQPIFTAADNDAILALSHETIDVAREVVWRVIGLSAEEAEKKSEVTQASGPSTS